MIAQLWFFILAAVAVVTLLLYALLEPLLKIGFKRLVAWKERDERILAAQRQAQLDAKALEEEMKEAALDEIYGPKTKTGEELPEWERKALKELRQPTKWPKHWEKDMEDAEAEMIERLRQRGEL